MQKLDFAKRLENIISGLRSREIVEKFKMGTQTPSSNFSFQSIHPILFQSKSSYDQMQLDERNQPILASLHADQIYSETNLAKIISSLSTTTIGVVMSAIPVVQFYGFHLGLLSMLSLAKDVLLNETLETSLSSPSENGVILFQIVIDGEGLETDQYIRIFSLLNDLVHTISKIHEEDPKAEIVLLDSGSDTNLAIKTGIETARSVFLIFKEVWDFIINHKSYKASQANKAILESLSVRQIIKEKVEQGVITDEEGQHMVHIIKTRTDDLIGLKVLPKSIVDQSDLVANRKVISGFDGGKFLTQPAQ